MTQETQQGHELDGLYRRAYRLCLPELQRLDKATIQPLNVDVAAAAVTAKGTCDRIKPLREAVASTLTDFDMSLWDQLPTYTFALEYTQWIWELATKSSRIAPDLVAQAKQQYELLTAVIQALVSRKLMDPVALKLSKKYKGQNRYAFGLLQLVEQLRHAWPRVAGVAGLSEAELTHAELTAERLGSGFAHRRVPVEQAHAAAEMRDRAFTLFIYAYGQVRHAVQYLRRDRDDADWFVPSLYKRRHKRRAKTTTDAVSVQGQPAALFAPQRPEESTPGPADEPRSINAVPAGDAGELQPASNV